MPAARKHPANYHRATINGRDICRVLEGRGWTSLTQLTGLLADKIAPENGVRSWQYYDSSSQRPRKSPPPPLLIQVARGKRAVVLRRSTSLARRGAIEHRRGTAYQEPYFRLTETTKETTDANKTTSRKKASP